MITSKYMGNYISTLLNANLLGKNFQVYTDAGDYKKSVKNLNSTTTYTNGIFEVIGSTLTPFLGAQLDTYTCQLTMFVDLVTGGKDSNGDSENLNDIRSIIKSVVDTYNGKSIGVTIDTKTYSMVMSFNYPTDGVRRPIDELNEALPLYWQINFIFFEDGVNANDCKVYINGIDTNATKITYTRQRVPDNNNFNGQSSTQIVNTLQGLSLDFVMPVLNNNLCKFIMEDILSGNNKALAIKLENPLYDYAFIGTFATNIASQEAGANLGFNIGISNGFDKVLNFSYDTKWKSTTRAYNSVLFTASADDTIVFWGDGTFSILDDEDTATKVYTDLTLYKTIRYYGAGTVSEYVEV